MSSHAALANVTPPRISPPNNSITSVQDIIDGLTDVQGQTHLGNVHCIIDVALEKLSKFCDTNPDIQWSDGVRLRLEEAQAMSSLSCIIASIQHIMDDLDHESCHWALIGCPTAPEETSKLSTLLYYDTAFNLQTDHRNGNVGVISRLS